MMHSVWLSIAGALSLGAQTTLVKQPVIQQRLEMVSRELPERRATLERLFHEAGCEVTTQPVRKSEEPNLICTLKGTDPAAGVILVGAHFDLIPAGMGAIDDWSGSALLPSLYETLRAQPHRHDYAFVAFAAEETGLNGSHEYVNRLTREQRVAIHAMINLECLGLEKPKVWASHADPQLLKAYESVVKTMKIPTIVVNFDKEGDDDAHPFRNAGIPTLTIHSVTPLTFPLLHNSHDQLAAIHPDVYYTTYKIAAMLLESLDSK
jgi:Zn-dependent M28 family amino/carboxypeptidase